MRFRLLLALSAGLGAAAQTLPDAYSKQCAACHGERGTGTDRGPNLVGTRSLRPQSEAAIRGIIRNGTRGGMPAFASMAAADLGALAGTVRAWNASAFDAHPAGDKMAGRALVEQQCLTCHMVQGQGGFNGPDLSSIGKQLTVAELEQTLADPSSRKGQRTGAACPSWAFCPDDPYGVVNVAVKRSGALAGLLRRR